ncbi:amidohydrolase family protein [Microbacteriaceae bacterium VKM Ac-2854]|nr:amidohydrolase family protein [Microbacteriaceae bacterium VKM Ac-2854]
MTVIDSHQHVWDPARAEYDWLGPDLAPIDRAIDLDEALPSMRRAGIDATVLVESADNDEDTELMFETARKHPEVVAIVAFAPLEDPRRIAELAERFAAEPLVVGVRNLIHNNPDPDWLLRSDVRGSLDILAAHGLTFDLVSVLPRHLMLVPELSRRHPGLKIVIDHLSKPPIGASGREPWWTLLRQAAENPAVYAKVSGLYSSVGDPGSWTAASVAPYIHHALDVFGADRLMFGSDWPISITAGGYDLVWDGLSTILGDLPAPDRAAIFGETARRFYGIDEFRLRAASA